MREIRLPRTLFVASLSLAYALAVWWPLEFSISALETAPSRIVGVGLPWSPVPRDALGNILFFIPLGLAVGGRKRQDMARVVVLACSLSLVFEVGQLFQPLRAVSIVDMALNGLGALLGAVTGAMVPVVLRRVARTATGPAWFAVGGILVGGASFALLQAEFGSLAAWSMDLPLLIGNEATGDRPWCGNIDGFVLSAGGGAWTLDSLVFLERQTDAALRNPECPTGIWYQTTAPVNDVVEAVRKSGRLQVELYAQPATLNQDGPARIVSISRDPDFRNITIGQIERDLIVRIRRRWAGLNGDRPFYRITNAFRTDRPIRISVDAGSETTEVSAAGLSVTHTSDVSRQWWFLLLTSREWRNSGWQLGASLLFWALLLGPFGAMAGAAAAGQGHSARLTAAISALSGFACWGGLQLAGVTMGGESAVWIPIVMLVPAEFGRRTCAAELQA